MVGATRRSIAAVASLLMVLFWVPGLVAPSASAATVVGSRLVGGFEIDGNFTPNDLLTSPGVDWNNVTAVETHDKVGNVDDTNFSGGSKECTSAGSCSVDNWVGATGVAPNKADISNVYVATRLLPDTADATKTDVWGYFGLTRKDNNGSVFYDIELNQKVNQPNKNGISAPDRSDGDVLIILDQNGNGDFSFSGSIQKWVDASDPKACQTGLVKPCWGVQTSLSDLGLADFFGKSNPTTIPGYKGVGSYASDEFGEVGVNLSAAGAIAGCPSTGFKVVNVRSKASPGSPTATDGDVTGAAEIKDYVAADVGIPSSCGELVIDKYGPGSSTTTVAGATFTIDPNPIPGETGTLTVHEGDQPGIDTVADGVIDLDPAKPGTYTVTETAPPPGYFLPATPSQGNVVVTEFGSGTNATVVTFHDPLGSLTVHKTGSGGALAGSQFTLTGPNGYSSTVLDADSGTSSDGNGNGTLTWSNLKTGTYTLHEDSAPTGYDTVSDRTFVIQSTNDDATHGRDLSATIDDPQKTTTLSIWKYHTESDQTQTKTNIAGAVFKLFQSDSLVALKSFDPASATLVGSCTTASNGICAVSTDSPSGDLGTHVITWDHYYYWLEQSVPFPYTVPDVAAFGPVHVTAANVDATHLPTPADDPKARLTTTATASATLPSATIKDTAHLSGVNSSAGGAIVFNAYGPNPTSCTGAAAFTSTVTTIHGPGDYDSAAFPVADAGDYRWSATYYPAYPANTGDFVAAACTDPTELSTVHPAQPTMTTTATDTHTTSGTIHDTAQLAGYATPLTGVQVTFKLFTSSSCTAGTEVFTSTVPVDSAGFAASADYAVTGTTGTYYWQAALTGNANNGTTNIGNDCGSTTGGNNEVSHAPVIAAVKSSQPVSGTSAAPTSVGLGSTISYTVTVSNSGQADDSSVQVTDAVPSGSTYVASSADAGGTFANGKVTWTVPVAAGHTVALHFQVTVDAGDPNGTRIENTAVADGTNTNTTYHVVQFPIVGAVKSSNPAYTAGNPPTPVQPGQAIDYTITVSNTGQADAANVTVDDPIPAGSTYVAGSADNGGSFVNGAVSWVLPAVGAGKSVSVHLKVTVNPTDANGTTIDNVAVVNGTSTNTTHHVVQFAVLAMGKTSEPAPGSIVQRGDTVTYTVTVVNSGLAAANGVTVSDTLPDHVTLVSGSAQPVVSAANGNLLTWLIDVAPGTTKTITYAVTVDSDAPEGATLTNVALIGGSCVGHLDAAACTTDHHVPTGALTLVKHVDETTAAYGDTVTYTFDAATTGALNQTGVSVTDVVPDKTTYVADSAACTDSGTCTTSYDAATRTVTWTLGDMAAGAVRHLTFQVMVDKPAFDSTVGLPAETITNLGDVQSAETATTPSNPVQTKVVGVLGVKLVRKPPVVKPVRHARLPFTGMPTQEAVTLALLMIACGIVLASVRRRGDA